MLRTNRAAALLTLPWLAVSHVGAGAERVTLPAAASLSAPATFYSDVRVFNRSYVATLGVSASYRCFVPSGCVAGMPDVRFTLAPREARGFDDMVGTSFQARGTAGSVEFEHDGSEADLVVTSRLSSTSPAPTVGMFVPGLGDRDAHAVSILTSLRNGGRGASFRTNVGVYNGGGEPVSVTIRLFADGLPAGEPIVRDVAARSGTQVSGVFAAAGAATHATENAVAVVAATAPVFVYAAVIDNATSDPILVPGRPDRPSPPPTPSPTLGPVRRVVVGPGFQFRDEIEGGETSTISVGTTIEWVWAGGGHSTTSGACTAVGCTADGAWNSGVQTSGTFRWRFDQAGDHPYFCDPHSDQMRGVVVVTAP